MLMKVAIMRTENSAKFFCITFLYIEIITDLTVPSDLNYKLHKPENDTFMIELTWEKLQCAFMYLVSITSDTDNEPQVATENNFLNISSLKKGNTYKFCVAGVNGNFKGHCLKPLTIDLEGIKITILILQYESMKLSIQLHA